uniref:Transposase n=1 Tax=Steinernema glaseri TaxID=37863 RepID=A0A1I7Y5R3_9BILA
MNYEVAALVQRKHQARTVCADGSFLWSRVHSRHLVLFSRAETSPLPRIPSAGPLIIAAPVGALPIRAVHQPKLSAQPIRQPILQPVDRLNRSVSRSASRYIGSADPPADPSAG